jgi:hypothetical protein
MVTEIIAWFLGEDVSGLSTLPGVGNSPGVFSDVVRHTIYKKPK